MSSIPRNQVPPGNANLIFFARILVKQHGSNAYGFATGRAALARDGGDLKRMQSWRRVAAFIRGLDEQATISPDH